MRTKIIGNHIKYCIIAGYAIFFCQNLYAGPPFFTDDPDPVDYGHWEFYIASQNIWQVGSIYHLKK